ncbi:DUF5675 family protein [Bermanella sp. R86510]|uniref:DUF5675 family protein n=1 Tax=unclassified Bermanella TaxID=2627862 RepID=UPI0037C825C2
MKRVVLVRDRGNDQGTVGSVYVGFKRLCFSIELPDRDNAPNYSRIPAGTYKCVWHKSPKFGWCYLIKGVPGRSFILIHPANWAGDSKQGYRCDLLGCIALGMRQGRLAGQKAVLASRMAVKKFNRMMGQKPFMLTIVGE